MTPEPEPYAKRPAAAPVRSKPKLAIANKQPVGAVLDFLAEGVEIAAGSRTEMTDAFIGYAAWCRATEHRARGVAQFVDAMERACQQFGIRIEIEGDCHYFADVLIAALSALVKTRDSLSRTPPQ